MPKSPTPNRSGYAVPSLSKKHGCLCHPHPQGCEVLSITPWSWQTDTNHLEHCTDPCVGHNDRVWYGHNVSGHRNKPICQHAMYQTDFIKSSGQSFIENDHNMNAECVSAMYTRDWHNEHFCMWNVPYTWHVQNASDHFAHYSPGGRETHWNTGQFIQTIFHNTPWCFQVFFSTKSAHFMTKCVILFSTTSNTILRVFGYCPSQTDNLLGNF